MTNLLSDVDAIIFDFGNVLIDLDYPRVIRRFSEAAKKNMHDIEEMVVTAPILQQFEVGKTTPAEFRSSINELLGTALADDELDDIWNSMLKSITQERMDKVLEIGQRFDTYVLSNTNCIHEQAYEKMIAEATDRLSLKSFVKKVYYSHEIGLRKPNPECYEWVIADIGIAPERMLFLDDRLDNVEAAREAGMKAIQILDKPGDQLNEIFNLG